MPANTLPAPGVVAPVLPNGPLVLKYLFGAHFANGDEYFQSPDDTSPFAPHKNSYYDLLELGENGEPKTNPLTERLMVRGDIELFVMIGQGCEYLVDLRDGHFEVCVSDNRRKLPLRAPFFVETPPPGEKLFLLFFRRRRQHMKVSTLVLEDLTPVVTDAVDAGQECEYHFGWTTLDGKHQASLVLV